MSWTVAADLATAFGTLVLAVATFLSIRSSNRSARTAERALQLGQRPILLPSLYSDPLQKIRYGDDHWLRVPGGRAVLDVTEPAAYLGIAVRDIGSGAAVIDGWALLEDVRDEQRRPADFYHLQRDLWVPAGQCGYIQVAVRDVTSADYQLVARADRERRPFGVDVLYSDIEETQHHIVRLGLSPSPHGGEPDQTGSVWSVNELRHRTLADGSSHRRGG